MLLMLQPRDISTYWELIKEGLKSVFSSDQSHLNNLLNRFLNSEYQVWLAFELNPEVLYGFVVTAIIPDEFTGKKDLLLYLIYGFTPASIDIWQEGIETLKIFARNNNCTDLIGYTKNRLLVEKLKTLGFETQQTVVSLSVQGD